MSNRWHNVAIPAALAAGESGKAAAQVYRMPEGCAYEGYTFAHPRTMVQRDGGTCRLRVSADWVFHLKRDRRAGASGGSGSGRAAKRIDLRFDDWLAAMRAGGCVISTHPASRKD